jgi:hypothetical protein
MDNLNGNVHRIQKRMANLLVFANGKIQLAFVIPPAPNVDPFHSTAQASKLLNKCCIGNSTVEAVVEHEICTNYCQSIFGLRVAASFQ